LATEDIRSKESDSDGSPSTFPRQLWINYQQGGKMMFLTAVNFLNLEQISYIASTLLMFSSFGMYPLSVALAGVLSNQFGPAILFPFGGLLLGLVMVFGMTQRALREI